MKARKFLIAALVLASGAVRADEPTDFHGDPLPPGAIARIGKVRLRHAKTIKAIAFAPDGKSIASAGLDGITRIWSAADGKELLRINNLTDPQYPNNRVASLVFTPDSMNLIGAHVDTPPVMWDVKTGEAIRTFGEKTYRPQWVSLAPDGKTLACGTPRDNGADRLYEVGSGKLIHQFTDRRPILTPISFAPDGKLFAFSDQDGLAFFEYQAGKLRELPRSEAIDGRLESLAFTSDGKHVVWLNDQKEIVVAEGPSSKIVRRLDVKSEESPPQTLLPIPNRPLVATAHQAGVVRIWDAESGRKIAEFAESSARPALLAISQDGTTLAVTLYDADGPSTIALLDPATGRRRQSASEMSGPIDSVALSPDGRFAASSSGGLRVHNLETGRTVWHNPLDGALAFTPDGKSLICGNASLGYARVINAKTGKILREMKTEVGTHYRMALSNDGKILALATGKNVELWEAATGKPGATLKKDASLPYALAFSPDGKKIAARDAGVIRFWDASTGESVREIQDAITCASIAFSPDGKLLACADAVTASSVAEPMVRLWNLSTGKEVSRFDGFGGGYNQLAFSPDGRSLYLGAGLHKPLYVFEVATGELRHTFVGHESDIKCLAVAPNGRFVATGSKDGTVLLWDVVGARDRTRPQKSLKAAELDRLWDQLTNQDAVAAYQAICRLRARPKQAVGLFERHYQPIQHIDSKRLAELLRKLDSAQFAVRDKASKDILGLGAGAEDLLRQSLKDGPSLEKRRRIEILLDRLAPNDKLRQARVFEVLEHAADAECRRFLKLLADGAPHPLTKAAQESLTRLCKVP